MNGIEKITEKIIADARADADNVIEDAERDAEDIRAAGKARCETVKRSYDARVAALRDDLAARGEAASVAERRNASLNARARLIDRAFNEARERIALMGEDEYYAFVETLLSRVAAERTECDAANEAGTDEYDEFDTYELILNARDSAKIGKKLIDKFGGRLGTKNLVLSEETANIDGGFMLRWGQVDMNCSVSGLIARSRDLCEREVCDILYPQGNKG